MGLVVVVVIVVALSSWKVLTNGVAEDAGVADDMIYDEYDNDGDDDDLGKRSKQIPEGLPCVEETDAIETDPLGVDDGSLV